MLRRETGCHMQRRNFPVGLRLRPCRQVGPRDAVIPTPGVRIMYSNPDCEDVVREAWKRYLQGKPSAQALRSLINGSWPRSAQAQVCPYQKSGPEPMAQDALEARINLQHDLMEASWAVLEHAKDFFQQTGQIAALVDADGAILSAKGDHAT